MGEGYPLSMVGIGEDVSEFLEAVSEADEVKAGFADGAVTVGTHRAPATVGTHMTDSQEATDEFFFLR